MASQFQCRFCTESYDIVLEFLDHFETHMTQNEQTQDKQQSASHKDNFSNSESDKEIQNPKSIEVTMNTTQRNEATKTYVCEKDLNPEENSKIPKKKSTFCEKCDKGFSRKQKLNLHIKTVHEKVKSHKCDLCLKEFGQKGDLQKHIKIVHDKVKSHKCNLCFRAFGEKKRFTNTYQNCS